VEKSSGDYGREEAIGLDVFFLFQQGRSKIMHIEMTWRACDVMRVKCRSEEKESKKPI